MGASAPKISPSPKHNAGCYIQHHSIHRTPIQETNYKKLKNKKGKASKLAVIDIIIKLAVAYSIILLI